MLVPDRRNEIPTTSSSCHEWDQIVRERNRFWLSIKNIHKILSYLTSFFLIYLYLLYRRTSCTLAARGQDLTEGGASSIDSFLVFDATFSYPCNVKSRDVWLVLSMLKPNDTGESEYIPRISYVIYGSSLFLFQKTFCMSSVVAFDRAFAREWESHDMWGGGGDPPPQKLFCALIG